MGDLLFSSLAVTEVILATPCPAGERGWKGVNNNRETGNKWNKIMRESEWNKMMRERVSEIKWRERERVSEIKLRERESEWNKMMTESLSEIKWWERERESEWNKMKR